MTDKGEGCYSCTRGELLAAMKVPDAFLWGSKHGPWMQTPRGELHPRRDTVRKLIRDGELVQLPYFNETQRQCGMARYGLGDTRNRKADR